MPASDSRAWSLSNDDKLTIGTDVFVRASWYGPENIPANTGNWVTKIGDPALDPIILTAPEREYFQVHDFANTTNMRLNNNGPNNGTEVLDYVVNNGVWEINYRTNAYGNYAVIDFATILDAVGVQKDIRTIKGVYFKYKVSSAVAGIVCYVRATGALAGSFNPVVPPLDQWTEVYKTLDLSTADSGTDAARRTSFGVSTSVTGTLYISDYYFIF
jgi:hypothetical protein